MVNDKGQLAVAHPPPHQKPIHLLLIFHVVVPIISPLLLGYRFITDHSFRPTIKSLFSLLRSATADPVTKRWYFQDVALLKKLWNLPSAKAYICQDTQRPHLEYQVHEGYCSSATQMCILKSFGIDAEKLPPQKRGESKPEQFAEHVTEIARESSEGKVELSATIVRGNMTYEEFLSTLREGLGNDNLRISCNYLRGALTGWERYYPTYLIMGMFSGHFSPILGIIENDDEAEGGEKKRQDNNPLVGIFDTNHKYSGAYLVPARELYAAVCAVDVMAKKGRARALVLVEKK